MARTNSGAPSSRVGRRALRTSRRATGASRGPCRTGGTGSCGWGRPRRAWERRARSVCRGVRRGWRIRRAASTGRTSCGCCGGAAGGVRGEPRDGLRGDDDGDGAGGGALDAGAERGVRGGHGGGRSADDGGGREEHDGFAVHDGGSFDYRGYGDVSAGDRREGGAACAGRGSAGSGWGAEPSDPHRRGSDDARRVCAGVDAVEGSAAGGGWGRGGWGRGRRNGRRRGERRRRGRVRGRGMPGADRRSAGRCGAAARGSLLGAARGGAEDELPEGRLGMGGCAGGGFAARGARGLCRELGGDESGKQCIRDKTRAVERDAGGCVEVQGRAGAAGVGE